MKALTVLQPWAQLLVLGGRRYHFRRWKTQYRGPLLIHAGLIISDTARDLCATEPVRSILARGGIKHPSDLPRGALIGNVILEDCLPVAQLLHDHPDGPELAEVGRRPGHWAWKMSQPQQLETPITFPGALRPFDVPDAVCSPLSLPGLV